MKLKVIVDVAESSMKVVDADTGDEVENIKAGQYRYAGDVLNISLWLDIDYLEVTSENGNKAE